MTYPDPGKVLADRAWHRFRVWPLWAQVLGWMLGWSLLGIVLLWRTPVGGRWRLAATAGIVVLFLIALALTRTSSPEPRAEPPTADLGGVPTWAPATTTSPHATRSPHATVSPATHVRSANASVTRVVDGDTIEVVYRGRNLVVRLIGIDTPESVAPGEPVQCNALAASRFTTQRLDGERVRLEFDVERTDRYGRTLAYVWLGHELFNETLVREGYAFVTTYPPDVKYVDRFLAAQREARAHDRGVWGRCVHPRPCDPSYPDVCIPPPPPELDCSDIPTAGSR